MVGKGKANMRNQEIETFLGIQTPWALSTRCQELLRDFKMGWGWGCTDSGNPCKAQASQELLLGQVGP